MADNPLGKSVAYPEHYAPELLHAIPRSTSRAILGIDDQLGMFGTDYWHAFELSWMNKQGKPQVACGELLFDADSVNIVESKSLKLYLHSLNNEVFSNADGFADRISQDLSGVSQSAVSVFIRALDELNLCQLNTPLGKCIDNAELKAPDQAADAGILKVNNSRSETKAVYSNLFRSNCPITGQPDWATVQIEYTGPQINESHLLSYLCSYRLHQGFHEECAERLFRDLMIQCQPEKLTVGMNFLRRGGLDINPYRSSEPVAANKVGFRLVRQ